MTGTDLQQIIENAGESLRSVADRWDVGKSTVHRECQRSEVRGLYRDAARTLRHQNGDEQ